MQRDLESAVKDAFVACNLFCSTTLLHEHLITPIASAFVQYAAGNNHSLAFFGTCGAGSSSMLPLVEHVFKSLFEKYGVVVCTLNLEKPLPSLIKFVLEQLQISPSIADDNEEAIKKAIFATNKRIQAS